MRATRLELIGQLRDLGLVEMKSNGSWGLTRDGEDFLDQFDLMRELDSRGAAQPPAGRRPSASRGAVGRPGDDVRASTRDTGREGSQ